MNQHQFAVWYEQNNIRIKQRNISEAEKQMLIAYALKHANPSIINSLKKKYKNKNNFSPKLKIIKENK